MSTAYITHPSSLLHDMGPYHPECPDRLTAIGDRLISAGLDGYLRHYTAPMATHAQLARVHGREYLAEIEAASPASGLHYIDPDTALCPHSLDAARHAAGALVLATDLVARGECVTAFCAVRPPGHHAERNRAMGFCLFNNVAVGAMHALAAHGIERVAIIDFDVHHGNGTEDIFAGDARVLMVSTFQHPLYPYSGTENAGAEHGQHPAARRQRQRRLPHRGARALAARAGGAPARAALRVGRVRRPSRGSARRTEAHRSGLRVGDARAHRRRQSARAAAGSCPRSKAAMRCPRWAAASPSTFASSWPGKARAAADGTAQIPRILRGGLRRRRARAAVRRLGRGRRRGSTTGRGWSTPTASRSRPRTLAARTNYVFHYPFAGTPCFLLRLAQAVTAPVTLQREDGASYAWNGGVGPGRDDRRLLGDLRAQARLPDARRQLHPLPGAEVADIRRAT